MADANVKRGFQGKIYLNAGTWGTPVWNPLDNVREVKVGSAFDKQDGTTRAGGGVKQSEPVQLDLSLTGKVRSDESDTTGFVVLETKFLTRAVVDVMILDGSKGVNGSRGYRFDSKLFKLEEDQGNEVILWRDFEIAPCISANAVQKAVVTDGTPVFTSLAA